MTHGIALLERINKTLGEMVQRHSCLRQLEPSVLAEWSINEQYEDPFPKIEVCSEFHSSDPCRRTPTLYTA